MAGEVEVQKTKEEQTLLKSVVRFFEVRKKRAELEVRRELLLLKKDEEGCCSDSEIDDPAIVEISKEIKSLDEKISKLERVLSEEGVPIVVPFEDRISELSEKLAGVSPKEIAIALVKKSGELYELLKQKGELVKSNYKNRIEIAKLNVLIRKLPEKTRNFIIKAVRNGGFNLPPSEDEVDEDELSLLGEEQYDIIKILRRLGIIDDKDAEQANVKDDRVLLEYNGLNLWVRKEDAERFPGILKELESLGRQMQFRTALKQVQDFSNEEENAFREIQKKYLSLINEKERIIDSASDIGDV